MHLASRTAANCFRSRLLRNQASPTSVRRALRLVPKQDRDVWLDLLLGMEEVPEDGPDLPRGCVPYLPCSVANVLVALDQARVRSDDVFVDVGAGTGRVALLAHLVTGAGCIGIEVQSALTSVATGRADRLNLTRTRFIRADAAECIRFVPIGTVFFLYCPFSGERLEHVLDGMEEIARTRPVRVCCVGMAPLRRPWLRRFGSTPPEVDVYEST